MPGENQYNIKKIVIVGLIIIVIAAVIGFLIIHKNNAAVSGEPNSKNVFPFGATSPISPSTATTNTSSSGVAPIIINPLTTSSSEQLRQITSYPVTGFFASIINKTIETPKLNERTGQTVLIPSTIPVDMIRWNTKQTGILMDAEVDQDAITETQTTETQIPDAQEIWFGNSGKAITYRYFNPADRSIESYVGVFPQTGTLNYCGTTFSTVFKRGAHGNEVKELQKYINAKLQIGLMVDGSFGSGTLKSLKQLQNVLNIPQTGVYDQATIDAINADCASIQAAFSARSSQPIVLKGSLLEANILRGTLSPDGTQMFFLEPSSSGVVGIVANSDGTNQKQIFQSPLTEWMPQWVNKTTIAMTTLASTNADGYMYFLDPTTGNFTKILGPIQGLTTLTSPDAETVLYSQSTDDGFVTKTYAIATGTTQTLSVATLPAKCVWETQSSLMCGVPESIPTGQYPDNWYEGSVSFGDDIWSIDTITGSTSNLLSPNQQFDIINPGMSPDDQYFYFINKIDGTLWSYRLE